MGKISLYNELTVVPSAADISSDESQTAKRMSSNILRGQMGYTGYAPASGVMGAPGVIEYGTVTSGQVGTTAQATNYCPFFLPWPITITDLYIEVTTGQAASVVCAAVYDARTSLFGGSLVTDFGGSQFTTVTNGVKQISSLSVSLPPGMHLLAWWSGTDGVAMRGTTRVLPQGSLMTSSGTHVLSISSSQADNTFPSTCTAAVATDGATPGIACPIWMRWTV